MNGDAMPPHGAGAAAAHALAPPTLGAHLRTLAWLRLRLLVGGLRRGNRGALEQVSGALQLVLRIVLGVVATLFSLGLAAGAAFVAWHFDDEKARLAFTIASSIFVGVLLVLTVVFAGRGGLGEMLDSPRLALLPLRRRTLHRLQVAAALLDPMLLALLPALLVFAATALWRGRAGLAMVAAVVGLALVAFLATFACAVAGLLQLLLRGRRRREALLLVVSIGFALLGVGPALLGHDFTPRASRTTPPVATSQTELRAAASTRWARWVRWTPPALYAHAITAAAADGAAAALPAGLVLAGWTAAAYGVSAATFRRLHSAPAASARATTARGEVLRPLPLLPPQVGALAAAQWRSLVRTTLARMAFLMTPLMLLVISRGLRGLDSRATPWLGATARAWLSPGVALLAIAGPLALVSLSQIVVNQYAFDGQGLQRQVLLPVSERELVAARRAASLRFATVVVGLVFAVAAIAGYLWSGDVPWTGLALAVAATYGVARLAMPLGLLLSALLPKTVDPSRLGRASQPHQGAVLLWMPLVSTLSAPPALLLGLLWRGPGAAAALGAAAAWMVLATLISWPLERAAAATFRSRRETLLLVAAGK